MDQDLHSKTISRKRNQAETELDSDDTPSLHPCFARFLVISSTEDSQPLSNLSPFVLGKALFAQIGTLKTIERLQRRDVLVETDCQLYSARLQELSELGGVPVQVTPHRSLNTTAVPAEGNGDLQTLICVLVARPRRCLTLSNPVP